MRKCRLFCDALESLHAEAGDFVMAKAEGFIADSDVCGELGAVISGRIAGRNTDEDITMYKSLGLAVQDLVAARVVYAAAQRNQKGTWAPWQ